MPGTTSRRRTLAGPTARRARCARSKPPLWTPVSHGRLRLCNMKPNRTKRTGVTARAGKGKDAGFHLVVAGCGGNIGPQLISLLARMLGIFRLTLVDFDRYEAKNLYSQDITPADLGQTKAKVQSRRVRRINPKLEVIAIVDRLEN